MNRKDRRAQKTGERPRQQPPAPVQGLFEEAVRRHQAGHLADADALYRQVLAMDSRHVDSLYLRGMIAAQVGRHDVAVALIGEATKINAKLAPFHFTLGASFRALGRLEDAVAAFRRGLDLQPHDGAAHNQLGITLAQQGRLDAAIAAFGKAIALDRNDMDAYLNLGTAQHRSGRREEAEASFRTVIARHPDHAAAHNNLGTVQKSLGKLDDAVASFRSAITLNPTDAAMHFNLGNTLHDQLTLDDAAASLGRATLLDPTYAEAHNNLAIALKDAWRLDEAAASYRTALDLAPNHAEAFSAYLAFLHYRPELGGEHILAESRRFGEIFDRPSMPQRHPTLGDPHRRLRVGYVSGDLRHHPVGYFLASVLDNHDRATIDVFCYSNNSRTDDITARLRSGSDHWRSIAGLSDDEAAKAIADDGIDILVDLAGHTALNRLPVFARRPAPVQVSWLGYWGTTGLKTMDYLLSDAITVPPGNETGYSERIVRLPGNRFCYAPPADAPRPADEPPVLRCGHVTFGSFNNPDKLTRDVVSLWAAVLQAVPGARLLLKWSTLADAGVRRRLTAAFETAGIEANRLILRGKSPHAAMLAEYDDIDIALDPFPFSGGLTSCEALWMGVPVVTLPDTRASSRQTLGFLHALDLTEWAATSPTDYVRIAAALAADRTRLRNLRQNLRPRLAASPLCDGPTFTRGLEEAYREMWRQWCEGETIAGQEAHQ